MIAETINLDPQELVRKSIHRRRALYTGLSSFLDEDQLYAALWLLEEEFSDAPSFSLHRFLSALSLQFELPSKRSEIYRELVSLLVMDDEALLPDPIHQMSAWRAMQSSEQQAPGRVDADEARGRVFEGVLTALMAEIDAKGPQSSLLFRNSLYANVEIAGLDLTRLNSLKQLLQSGRGQLKPPFTLEQMRELLHGVYLLSCEQFGPQQADALLSAAVVKAQLLPEAGQFAPRQLL